MVHNKFTQLSGCYIFISFPRTLSDHDFLFVFLLIPKNVFSPLVKETSETFLRTDSVIKKRIWQLIKFFILYNRIKRKKEGIDQGTSAGFHVRYSHSNYFLQPASHLALQCLFDNTIINELASRLEYRQFSSLICTNNDLRAFINDWLFPHWKMDLKRHSVWTRRANNYPRFSAGPGCNYGRVERKAAGFQRARRVGVANSTRLSARSRTTRARYLAHLGIAHFNSFFLSMSTRALNSQPRITDGSRSLSHSSLYSACPLCHSMQRPDTETSADRDSAVFSNSHK